MISARTPEEMPRLWAETFQAGDLDALVALYEADAMLERSRCKGLGTPKTWSK
jgi:ketosteroid isomerase-like protein